MQDRVPLYPGRVKLVPVSGQENTYDMVRADQPTQTGDPLNKDTLLKDATAALFGLGTDAVPDDMLNALAHTGDLHVWKRTHGGAVDYPVHPDKNGYQEGSDKKPAGYTLENEAEVSKLYSDGGFIYVSDNVEVNDDGSIFPNGENVSTSAVKDKAKGKYVYNSKENVTMYFVPVDAVITTGYDSSSYISINKAQKVIGYPAIPAETEIEYIGQLGDRSRVITGSYVGNGEYGEDKPTKLVFDSEVKALFILPVYEYGTTIRGNNAVAFYSKGSPVIANGDGSSTSDGFSFVTVSAGEISWYSKISSDNQLNKLNYTYYYLAVL